MVSGFPSVPVVSHPGHQRLVSSAGAFFSHRSESYFVFAAKPRFFIQTLIYGWGPPSTNFPSRPFAFHGAVSYSETSSKAAFFHVCLIVPL